MSTQFTLSTPSSISSLILQIHEKEEEEMNEKNDNANCLNEEPLITADQVRVYVRCINSSQPKGGKGKMSDTQSSRKNPRVVTEIN